MGTAQEVAFDKLARDLTAQSWTVMPGFLGRVACTALRKEIRVLRGAGNLRAAGVGRAGDHHVDPEIRSDLIHWLDEPTFSVPQLTIWKRLDVLRVALNRRLFLGLSRVEVHLTAYQSGGVYHKHLDTFRNSTRRVISFVVYLNTAWRAEHGGQLRLYQPTDHNLVAGDVAPHSGTLACFLSAEIAHEVLPTTCERLSITGWFSGS